MRVLIVIAFLLIGTSKNAYSEQGWTSYSEIEVLDSLPSERNTFITLKGYSNSICSANRIMLTSATDTKFNQLFSIVLSAFHAGAKVSFLLSNDNDCVANRVTTNNSKRPPSASLELGVIRLSRYEKIWRYKQRFFRAAFQGQK